MLRQAQQPSIGETAFGCLQQVCFLSVRPPFIKTETGKCGNSSEGATDRRLFLYFTFG
jgi:hypothetical protein